MASEETIAVIHRYLKRLLDANLPVEGLVLYGSHARGDARPTSDIDVLVLLDDRLSQDEVFRLWPELDFLTHGIDSRIETWPVTASCFQNDDVSPLLLGAGQGSGRSQITCRLDQPRSHQGLFALGHKVSCHVRGFGAPVRRKRLGSVPSQRVS